MCLNWTWVAGSFIRRSLLGVTNRATFSLGLEMQSPKAFGRLLISWRLLYSKETTEMTARDQDLRVQRPRFYPGTASLKVVLAVSTIVFANSECHSKVCVKTETDPCHICSLTGSWPQSMLWMCQTTSIREKVIGIICFNDSLTNSLKRVIATDLEWRYGAQHHR